MVRREQGPGAARQSRHCCNTRSYWRGWSVLLAAAIAVLVAACTADDKTDPLSVPNGHYRAGRYQEAARAALPYAEAGAPQAQALVGRALTQTGAYDQALIWLLRASRANDRTALETLGDLYFFGAGINQNFRLARSYYFRAAVSPIGGAVYPIRGYALARLGFMDMNGFGGSRNVFGAVRQFREAADLASGMGMFGLGLANDLGVGAARDRNRANYWYGLAVELAATVDAQAGYERAIRAVRRVPQLPADATLALPPIPDDGREVLQMRSIDVGVLISGAGQVLTHFGGVDDCKQRRVRDRSTTVVATIMATSPTDDVAILATRQEWPRAIGMRLRWPLQPAERVAVGSFPLFGVIDHGPLWARGEIDPVLSADADHIGIRTRIGPDEVTGPVVDISGNLVAFMISGHQRPTVLRRYPDWPVGYAPALPITRLRTFLDDNFIDYDSRPFNFNATDEDMIGELRRAMVLVECWR